MASALGFSFISDESEKKIESKIENKVKKRCRTLRKKSKNKKSSSKINNLLNSLSVYQNKQENDDDELENFVPLEEKTEQFENEQIFSEQPESNTPEIIENMNPSPVEGFSQLNSVSAQDYYKQYIPYYNKVNNDSSVTNQDDLMKKLNYMITLLEEERDEKTENVTEELVLYLFLGVFVIFVVDSFARAGKYTR
jgi:hypothetical protein